MQTEDIYLHQLVGRAAHGAADLYFQHISSMEELTERRPPGRTGAVHKDAELPLGRILSVESP